MTDDYLLPPWGGPPNYFQLSPTDLPCPLHEAAYRSDLEGLRALLADVANGHDVHYQADDYIGATPLHVAANASKDPAILELLLNAGADVNARSSYCGETPLMYAATGGNVPAMEVLLDAGADSNVFSSSLFSPLHSFVIKDPGTVRAGWVSRGVHLLVANGVDPNAEDDYGCTPLHRARDEEAIVALLACGADARARNHEEESVLYRHFRGLKRDHVEGSRQHDPTPGIAALLAAGAEPNIGNGFESPLHKAVADHRAVRLVLAAGADPNNKSFPSNNTPLHNAVEQIAPETVALLIAAGADPNAADSYGQSPLEKATSLRDDPSYTKSATPIDAMIEALTVGGKKAPR